ncbi:MAG: 4-hydroxy-tetrahydrodipicolinate synthase [Bacteroidales bacterium]|nr:4-hydroxy-tetrahydrodipicolinate synthase [Bacteroidales bacterium]
MSTVELKGCGTALVTPFTADGAVDYAAYAALVDRQVASGVHFLVALATTGETPALTGEERVELLKITREHAAGLPVLVGCGSNAVHSTLANMRLVEPYGVDAWLVVVPFYNKPTQEGQYQYFKTIAAHTDKPVVIYNVPGRTGANMSAETCLRLARDVKNIVATKEASGKYEQIEEILRGAPADFTVLSGDDDMTLSVMKIGAKGVVSVASNAAPAQVSALVATALAGDYTLAAALESALKPLFKACFLESNPIPVKAALNLLGCCSDAVRLPLVPASDATREHMARVLKDLGLLV